jgi:proteasome lid subunit RPN8/RPN11
MYLNSKTIDEICKHALKTYPEECCGIVTGAGNNQTVHFCRNIQNRLHAEDPQRYPCDARTAYVIERSEFDRIVSTAKNNGEEIEAFYHSHADHEAYFSVTDVEAQTVLGEPEFPDALHIVVSVINGKIHNIKGFKWEKVKNNFIAVDIKTP